MIITCSCFLFMQTVATSQYVENYLALDFWLDDGRFIP